MIVLKDYIDKESSSTTISYVPTYSNRGTLAKKYVNQILADHPEYYNFIKLICEYPLIKWGEKSRKKINLAHHQIESSYFGIDGEEFIERQKEHLKLCDTIIDFIEGCINKSNSKDVLYSIHGYKTESISTYKVNEYYKEALLDLCINGYKDFKYIEEKIKNGHVPEDDDIAFVYRKADLLLRMRSILDNGKTLAYKETVELLDLCINCLDTYYLQDPYLKDIARLYSLGDKEKQICEKTGKSRSFVRNMKSEAAKAIAYIIWGYVV